MANPFAAFDSDDESSIESGSLDGHPTEPIDPFALVDQLLNTAGCIVRAGHGDGGALSAEQSAEYETLISATNEGLLGLPSGTHLATLRLRLELLQADFYHLRSTITFKLKSYADVKTHVARAVQHIRDVRLHLDEDLAHELGGVPGPLMLDPGLREQLFGLVGALERTVNSFLTRTEALIAQTEAAMQPLAGGRDAARARLSPEDWATRNTRPGWVPCDPAARLAALTTKLAELRAFRAAMEEALAQLAGTADPRAP